MSNIQEVSAAKTTQESEGTGLRRIPSRTSLTNPKGSAGLFLLFIDIPPSPKEPNLCCPPPKNMT